MPANKKKTLAQLGEFGLIDVLAKLAPKRLDVLKGIGDDAAVVSCGDKKLILTTDMLIEDVHFTRRLSPQLIGHKALACSLSDVAAMGAEPLWALVSLGVPGTLSFDFVKKIYLGMRVLAGKYHVGVVGGDTVSSKKIIINVSLVGQARHQPVFRSGARKKDKLFVTGSLGRSLKNGRHAAFEPRLKETAYLMKHFRPTAMMDISDGLAQDLKHLLKASKAGAVFFETFIPRAKGAATREALCDGEDFELLFTLPSNQAKKLMRSPARKKFRFTYLGEIIDKKFGCLMVTKNGQIREVTESSFRHF